MRLLLASSEVHPYSKSGGLADMTAALAKSLARLGHQVGVVTPLYGGLLARLQHPQPVNGATPPALRRLDWWLGVPLGGGQVEGEVWVLEPAPNLTVYFIRHDGFYDRESLYQRNGWDYPDNAERFLFFSKAVTHLARHLPWRPELVHVHDWQTGVAPLLIKHQAAHDGWVNPPRTVLTIHNLAYQGMFGADKYDLLNLPRDYFHPHGAEFHGALNCLKAGLEFADRLTTVSPRYAREITTEEYGHGLDGVLRRRQRDLTGILNGVDAEEWNPAHDAYLRHPFSADDLSGKAAEKEALQKEFGLPVAPDVPLFANITRLADQKGVDLQLAALEEMLAAPMQFVMLGSGSPAFEHAYQRLMHRYPRQVAVRIGFDQALSHRIEAGADFYLMPSRFEPSGLNQMYSLRYGAIPIVRRTGGLDDSVVDFLDDLDRATGIKFNAYASRALAKAIRKALVLYQCKPLLRQMQQRGMRTDFGWDRTARAYLEVYRG